MSKPITLSGYLSPISQTQQHLMALKTRVNFLEKILDSEFASPEKTEICEFLDFQISELTLKIAQRQKALEAEREDDEKKASQLQLAKEKIYSNSEKNEF